MNPTLHNEPGLQKRDGEACFGSSTFTAFTDRPPPPVSPQLLITPKHRRLREIPYFLLLLGGHPRVSLNAWKRNSFILATTANICHPAQAGPLPGPHVPGILPQHRPAPGPGPPVSETRLRASSAPASPTLTLSARAPKTTLSVTIQWNVTAPNSSAPRLAPRHESRVSLIAEFSQEPKLHHVGA